MNIKEYAKSLGIDITDNKDKPLNIEVGKAGYNQYLADIEQAKATTQAVADKQKEQSWWDKVSDIILGANQMSNKMSDTPIAHAFNTAVDAYKLPEENKPKDDWTDEERWRFGEKYSQDKASAYEYAKELNEKHLEDKKQSQKEKIASLTNQNTLTRTLGSAASVAINAGYGFAGYLDALAQKAAGRDTIKQNILMPHEVSETIQGTVAGHLNDKYGTLNENVPILGGKGLGDVYSLGMSIGQSALSGATGGTAGTLVQFFGMSASQGVSDALSRGASADQALAFGTMSGLAEAIPEMISVKSLLGIASAEGVQNLFKSVLKQAGEEAKEELTTSIITEVADRWIMGGKSQFQMRVNELVAGGMDIAQAEKTAWTETIENIAFDTISGAMSGGISGAGAVGVNRVNQQFFQKEANETAKKALSPEASKLIEEAKKYDSTKKRAEALEKKVAEGKELTGYELRMLVSQLTEASRNADVDTVRKAIVEKMKSEGVSDSMAKTLGEIALNKAIGNEVSKVQDLMLKRNENALKVYNQISEEMMESGLGDSEWAQNTPIQRLRAEKRANEQPDTEQRVHSGIERLKADIAAKYGKDTREYKINMASIEGKFGEVDDKIVYKPSENSKIHVDGISSSLTQEDMIELSAIEKIANELGVDIHVYETTVDENGERTYVDKTGMRTADSGYYDPSDNSIHIDLRAGENGEGTMLYTASHELVHFMKKNASEHYAALEELVTKELVKGGFSIDQLVEEQRKKDRNGLTDEELREEVVAEACQNFLASKNAVAEIKALKTKNKGLWTALKKFFTSLFNKINKVYKTVPPDSAEGKYIADMHKAIKPIRDAFMEGVVAAGEKYTAERKALGDNAQIKVNGKGEFVQGTSSDGRKILSNARTYNHGGRATLKATLESEGYSADDVKAALAIMDGHMELVKQFGAKYTAQDIANNATLSTDVKTGVSVLSALISNGDYPVNIDLLTICKKRKAYQGVINRLCKSGLINTATIDSLAIAEINKILGKYGFETACLGCYVESRRIRIQEWAQTICKEWNEIVDSHVGKGKGEYFNTSSETFVEDLSNDQITKLSAELEEAYERDGLKYGQTSVVNKMKQLQREVPSLRKYLSVADLITPEGRTNLKKLSSELNSLVAIRYGTNTPKIIQEFNPYNSELAIYGKVPKGYKSLRDYLYAIGGARMQSFSDFIIENWFDYAQIVGDLSARNLPMHTYTKEIALVKLFGMTGIKINMSLIPDVDQNLGKDYAGLTVNDKGEYELIWADKDRNKATGGKSYMQSFNFADAMALQNDPNYSSNVGTIAIGISDMQIRMMLKDSRIRMVIPYHTSGMNPIFAHLVGVKNYNDYTNDQTTGVKKLLDANGKELSAKLTKDQKLKLASGFEYNKELQRLGDARAAAKAYLEWCADSSKHTIEINGKTYYATLTPKFEKFARDENYYKLLIDYNPYDCITEESKPQGDVQQIYPDNFAEILEEELKRSDLYNEKQEAKWDDAMGEIESYLKDHTKADTVAYADEHGIKLSAKDRKGIKKSNIRHKSRSYTAGQMAQVKANLSHNKVYSKKSAMELVSKIAPNIRNRSFEALSDQLWQGLNTYTSLDDKRQFAKDMAEMFVDRMMVDTLVKHSEWDKAVERMAYIKPAVNSINLRDEDISELKYILDKDYPRLRGRWGYKTPSNGEFKRPYGLDEFISDLSREMPGMSYLAEMHPAEALIEVDKIYTELSEQVKEKYESAYNEFSDEEIKEIQQGIEYEIMHAYTELGDKTKIAKYLEEKFDYYQSRIDYWKAENAKVKKVTRWHNIISTKALQIKDLKKGAYYNATQHHQDIFKNSIETLANIQWRANLKPTQKISEIFENLKQWYTMQNPMLYNKDSELNVYSDTIATYITKIADSKGAFDDNTYGMVYDVMNHLYIMMRNYNKIFRAGRWEDAPDLAKAYLKVMEDNKRNRSAIGRVKDTYINEFLEPMAVAKRADNYNDDGFYTQTVKEMREASIAASIGEMRLRKKYDTFIDENKKYLTNAAKETVKYRGFDIPKIHLIGLYMTMKREHARAGLAIEGFEFYVQNRWWDSADKVEVPGFLPDADNQDMINAATVEQMKIIEKSFTDVDKQYIENLETLFNEDLRNLKVERDMERQGYTNATVDYYYPIIRIGAAESVDTTKISDQNRATNSSFNKNTVKGAKQKLVIISADAMVNRHITDMCKYYYMSQAFENYNVLYYCDVSGNPNNPVNLARFSETIKLWEKDKDYFRKLVADMQGIREPQSQIERALEKFRGNYAKFALGLNAKVLATQFSSIIAAGNVLGFKSLVSLDNFKVSSADIDKYCPIATVRSYEKVALKAMSVTDKLDKTTELFTSAISVVDSFVIKRLFASCQIEAEKRGEGKLGTEQNKIAAGKILEKAIIETQQNSYATERSQAMRSRNEILKSLTMFTADSMKLISRVHEAAGELRVAMESKDTARIKKARKQLAKSLAVSITSSVYLAAIAVLFNWILAKDDEEKEPGEKVLAFGLDVLGNSISALPGISDLYEMIVNGFEVESAAFDTINNVLKGVSNITKDAHNLITGNVETSIEDVNRDLRTLLYGIGQMTGVPVRNVYNLSRGILDKFSPKATYYLDSKFYETSLKTDFEKAVEEGNMAKTTYILSLLYDDRIESDVSMAQRKEIIRLTNKEYNVLPKSIPGEIKRNGETYVLTDTQKDAIAKEYSKVVPALDKLISSSFYSGKTDKDKAYLIDYYHDKYYEVAVNKALKISDVKVYLYNAIGFSTYAKFAFVTRGIESDKDKNGNTVSGSKKTKIIEAISKVSKDENKNLLYIASLGYSLTELQTKKLCKYLNSLSVSASQKKYLAESCNLTYKNGKIYP